MARDFTRGGIPACGSRAFAQEGVRYRLRNAALARSCFTLCARALSGQSPRNPCEFLFSGGNPVWYCALLCVASPSRRLRKSEWRREAGFAGEQRRKVEFFAAYARVAPSEFPPFLMGERAGERRFNGRRTSWVLANSEQGLRRGEGAEGRGENRMSGGRCDPLLSRRRRWGRGAEVNGHEFI